MLSPRRVFRGLAFLAAIWPAGASGEDTEGFSLTYDAYVSGLKALSLQFDLEMAGEDPVGSDYKAEVEIETSGLVSAFVDWRLEATSWGQLSDDGAVPDKHRTANYQGEVERWVAIDYDEAGDPAVRSQPTIDNDNRNAVAVTEIAGTIDPMSALTQTLMLAKDGTVCPQEVRIFDGRRRYDLHAEPMPRKVFSGSRTAPFSGSALGCRATLERIAGFKEYESRQEHALSSTIEMWMAPVMGDDVWVPVRLVLRGKRGRMIVHLKEAQMADGTVMFGG